MPADALIGAALAGDRRALARLLSRVEAGGAAADAIVQALYPRSGDAHVIGVTGAPGTGKSTLVAQLARALRRRSRRVAIVAVDPSSPFTGGALLGDRVRMSDLAGDPDIFIRSMASRGAGGGLAEQTAAACVVLAAAGFGAVVVETVGVGQDELAIAQEAQTTVVVTAPGSGDDVQALKAGILEIADVQVVNKADREGADRLVAELTFGRGQTSPPGPLSSRERGNVIRDSVASGHFSFRRARGNANQQDGGRSPSPHGRGVAEGRGEVAASAWTVPILKTVATTGEGVEELAVAIERHREWLRTSGAGEERARALAGRHILRSAATTALREAERRARASGEWERLVAEVAARRRSPADAARHLLQTPALPNDMSTASACAGRGSGSGLRSGE